MVFTRDRTFQKIINITVAQGVMNYENKRINS